MKKFIVPTIAALVFIAGLVSLMIPFLPFGWLFIALASLLLTPYFKFMRKFIGWLAQKDNSGIIEKAGEKASDLYRWADDHQRAEQLETIIEENCTDSDNSKN